MKKLLCSTGALVIGHNGRTHTLISDVAPCLHCDGFEFMMSGTWYDSWEQVANDVRKMPISFPVFHTDKRIGELISRNEEGDDERAYSQFEINCKMAQMIGAEKLVLHLWGGIPSDWNIRHNIESFSALNETAKRFGLFLTVENVVCNRENPLLHLEQLKTEYPDIAFTFDIRFAQFHGQLNTAFEDENKWLWESVKHIHISDYSGGYMEWDKLRSLHPGEGKIDFEELFRNLKRVQYSDTVTVESTSVLPDGNIDFERLNRSFDFLRELMN